MKILVLLLVTLSVTLIKSETCNSFKTCGQCIGNSFNCTWCSSNIHNGPRCRPSTEPDKWCDINPYSPQKEFKTIKDDPLRSVKPGEGPVEPVQLKPQNIFFKARPGVTEHLNIYYKPAEDYPLDVYYLMDNSYTMINHKKTLERQAQKIYDALTELTNNVQLGAGSFIEKFSLPYASPTKHSAYSFKNHLSLTKNMEQFYKKVASVTESGNYDDPEAGLDALVQVMVCNETIGWRKEARRMIVFCTDNTYHSAGDGKIVGAVKPNDLTCHTANNTGQHDLIASLTYDYPSVNQINKLASEKKINIIYAVLKDAESEYTLLSNNIEGSKYVELSDKSDIVQMITTEYLNSVQSLVLSRLNVPSYVDLSLEPSCTETSKCPVRHGESVEIKATLQITGCPKDHSVEVMEIGPVGLYEKLKIDIEAQCQCECEKEGNGEANSLTCNSNGTYQCGVCKCNPNRYGEKCQCAGSSTEEDDLIKCKMNSNETECSGKGVCSCGQCNCSGDFYGPFCQFGRFSCPAPGGKLCNGKGSCLNDTCVCTDGWTGDECTCPTDVDACIGPNSKECSGNGKCKCGVCECTELDSKKEINEEFCTYPEDRCKELEDYVECVYNQGQETCDHQFSYTSNRTVLLLNSTEIKAPEWRDGNWKMCRKVLADGNLIFKFLDDRNATLILIQKEKEIPPVANIWIPVCAAIGTIILIGILAVIGWKIAVDIHDAKEYEKFEKEAADSGMGCCVNVCYKPPTMLTVNPMRGNSWGH